jgi:peroxiredoxin
VKPRWIALLLCSLIFTGCDRGTHPDLIGKSAPDFTVSDSDRSIQLKQLEGSQIIVLNFWATWCPPCVDEIPSLGAMQAQLQARVKVLAVSIDEDPEAYHRFLQEYGVHFLTVRDPSQHASSLYGTRGWPETYVIDRRGVVRRKFIGPVNWTEPDIVQYLNSL